MKKAVIIDYNLGNIFSISQACKVFGIEVEVTTDYNKIISSDGVILPGVCAFGDAMNNLKKKNLVSPIKDFIESGKPFLGICLGMQLLFSESYEFGIHKGMNIVEGYVNKFDNSKKKIPHTCWNKIYSKKSWKKTPLNNIKKEEYMYFVHSFYVKPQDTNYVLAKTKYGEREYCSSICKNNIFATQFHPEKSGKKGLEILKNWTNLL